MRKRFFIGITISLIACGVVLSVGTISNLLSPFKSFSVIVDNQSDVDISSIEVGLIRADSKKSYTSPIKAGQKKKFKPKLSLNGEGAIYLRYTNSNGQSKEQTVCGYTEYLSGHSKVTITNESTTVVQQCN
ncbi:MULTISPECIES: hypothetical protein [Paenibacillus]|uniref:hypothetical protein n=1 Tax=Paenibacillus TaxID=44249 RepID=UPI00096CA40B|nr:hypothetical protein [Paenibacillus odorifer]OMD28640.1 hypothetical protein BJP48_02715 [Paenibacillus odorifer]OME26022.1 hypothetical protein BSK57_09990 [Paenibacillus odorifer]